MSLEAEWAWGTALPLCGLILATAQSNEILMFKMKRRLFFGGGGGFMPFLFTAGD